LQLQEHGCHRLFRFSLLFLEEIESEAAGKNHSVVIPRLWILKPICLLRRVSSVLLQKGNECASIVPGRGLSKCGCCTWHHEQSTHRKASQWVEDSLCFGFCLYTKPRAVTAASASSCVIHEDFIFLTSVWFTKMAAGCQSLGFCWVWRGPAGTTLPPFVFCIRTGLGVFLFSRSIFMGCLASFATLVGRA
jgi:hypothetical protein